ncbi:hypothetical protein ACFRFH_12025 [Leifsonia sp. NPDC056824]|uniref:hypothetical protein n=1 Tax=Leifsonia sp. NPDC056824 TaxID=3345953 RepID=UPI0036D1D55B
MAGLYKIRAQLSEQIYEANTEISAYVDGDDSKQLAERIADWLMSSNYLSEAFFDSVPDTEEG